MTTRELLWEQNGLPTMVNIMRVASAKSQSVRGASHQPASMGSSPVYLVVDELALVFYGPL